jgi:hypothetical protein
MLSMISSRAIRPSGAPINIAEELGLTHTQKVYERRIEALATPRKYNTARKAEWDKLTAAVTKTYDDTVTNAELIASGIPITQRQELAVNAAKMTYATQNAILEANFPSGAQALVMQGSALGQFPGAAMGAAPRRAPARRKSSKKK